MSLDNYLEQRGVRIMEGYSQQVPGQVSDLIELTKSNCPINVMEIGFNSGFSTLLMLISNTNMHITCFDLGEHSYTLPCYEKIKETFGDRISIVIGDSTKTLQDFSGIFSTQKNNTCWYKKNLWWYSKVDGVTMP